MRNRLLWFSIAASVLVVALANNHAALSAADTAATQGLIMAGAMEAEYVPVTGFPRGADSSVLQGNPSTGPVEMYFRLQPGTRVPMHLHTSSERAVGIHGTITMTFPDGSMKDIRPGQYMFMPRETPHAASCPASGPACIAYIAFDGAFNVTWLDQAPVNPNP